MPVSCAACRLMTSQGDTWAARHSRAGAEPAVAGPMLQEASSMRGNIAEHRTHGAQSSDEPARSPQLVGNQDMASTPTTDGRDNGPIAAPRRGYGTYRSVGLDLILAFVGQILLAIPLMELALALFVLTSHTLALEPGRRAFDAWLTTPQATLAGLLATDGAMLLVLWLRLRRLRLGWSVVGLGA